MQSFEYYEPGYFDSSKTYTSWVKLFIADLYKLKLIPGYEAAGVRFYKNHPIRWIQVVAVVLAAEVKLTGPARNIAFGELELDDGSGAVVTAKLHGDVYASVSVACGPQSIDIGSLVKVKGTLKEGFAQIFIEAVQVQIVRDPLLEITAWQERLDVRRKLLDVPWKLDPVVQKPSALRQHERILQKEATKRAERIDVAALEQDAHSVEALKRQIMQHLEQRQVQVFTVRDLHRDARLVHAAEAVAQKRYRAEVDDACQRMLGSCLVDLVSDGLLVTSHVTKGTYCTIGLWNLGPAVTAVLDDLARQGIDGVRAKDVWEKVKALGFARVSKQRVREVMQALGTEHV